MKKLKLEIVNIKDFPVVGIATKCISHNEKSDFYDNCDDLWEKIVTEGSLDKIQNKVNDNVVAAYLNYETDHSKPFDFVVGCQVSNIDTIPEGMQAFEMENGVYLKVRSSEKITECHSETWQQIWESDIDRKFKTDFEVYSSEIRDRKHAEMDIYIGIEGKLKTLQELPEHIEVIFHAHE